MNESKEQKVGFLKALGWYWKLSIQSLFRERKVAGAVALFLFGPYLARLEMKKESLKEEKKSLYLYDMY